MKISSLNFFILLALAMPLSLPAQTGSIDATHTILMTKNGFEPKELTIKQGEEVTFVNNDTSARWPASNFHPTHTLYPEFDPLKGIPAGSSWKFKFEKVGTWRMHDHLFPHMTGTIIVLANPDKAATSTVQPSANSGETSGLWAKIKSFFWNLFHKNSAEAQTSLDQNSKVDPKLLKEFKAQDERAKYAWLEKRAELESPKVAWEYVLAAYNTANGVVGNPHDMAHLVGQLLFKSYGFEGLSICTPVFAFGCYHGLMEVAFDKDRDSGDEKDYQKNLGLAQAGCSQVGPDTSPTYWSCIHGMGHGIATYRDHDLDLALKDCDTLTGSVQTYCHDGVFMEFSISAPANFYKQNDPIYPCDSIGENYKVACARSQVQVMRQRFSLNTTQIADICLKSGNEKIIYHCIDALGYFVAQGAAGAPEKIVSGCHQIADEKSAAQCLAAAAGELVFQNSAGWQTDVKKVCQSLSDNYATSCETRVEQVKQSYGRE